jgi:hypothetical protein
VFDEELTDDMLELDEATELDESELELLELELVTELELEDMELELLALLLELELTDDVAELELEPPEGVTDGLLPDPPPPQATNKPNRLQISAIRKVDIPLIPFVYV